MTTENRYAAFGRSLSRLMTERNVSAADLSGRLQISTQMVGKYLRGESLPGPERLNTLCEMFGVDPAGLGAIPEGGGEFQKRPRTPRALMKTRVALEATRYLERSVGDAILDDFDLIIRSNLPALRPDLDVVEHPRVSAFFRYRPDFMVAGASGPVLAIEVKTGAVSIPSLVGTAYNWRVASNGAPLFVAFALFAADFGDERAIDFARPADRVERLIESLNPLMPDGLLAGYAISVPEETAERVPDGHRVADMKKAVMAALADAPR